MRTSTRQRGRRSRATLAAAGLLLSTACGARWTNAQQSDVAARGRATGVQAAATAGDASGSTSDTTPTAADTSGGAAASSGGSSQPSAAGATGTAAAKGAGTGKAPCAAASTATGVTSSQIHVGSISDLSGPVPGLGASAAAAARAYVAYRNATGGVCGRQIVLQEADDGTDAGRYRTIVTDLSSKVLGIAGGFATGDVGGNDVIQQQHLPVVNVPSSKTLDKAPSVFNINPGFRNVNAVIGKYRYLHDQGVRKASVTYIAVDQSRAEAQSQEALMKAAGIQVVQIQEVPLSTLSYDSAARSVANSGADYLLFIADAHGNQSMAQSMANTGYKLKYAEYFVFSYGTDFIQATGSAGEGAITWLRTLPAEETASSPELSAYVQWMSRTAPGQPVDEFAADSWTGAKAFFDSLAALPGPISRDALVAQLRSVTTYDAGGMLGPIALGAKLSNACQVGMQVVSGVWKRMTPDHGFLC